MIDMPTGFEKRFLSAFIVQHFAEYPKYALSNWLRATFRFSLTIPIRRIGQVWTF